MQEQSAAGRLDIEAVWSVFRALALTSPNTGLSVLAQTFHAAPAKERLALAGTIAGLLAPIEWPIAWREPGRRVSQALEEVNRRASHFAAQLKDDRDAPHATMIRLGGFLCYLACGLLSAPCRRDELQVVAGIVNTGILACSDFGKTAVRGEAEAWSPLLLALGAYAQAAREFNAACGAVVFTGASVGLPANMDAGGG
jgi:type II secretory pathway component PulM